MNAPHLQPRPAAPRLGRYELLADLAAGGMATVHVARSQGPAGFARLVAVKELHPHLARDPVYVEMFLDEARLAARIHHPNVVATLDSGGSREQGYFLAMEYVEGGELADLQRAARERRKRLSAPVALRIVVDALQGLAAAHAARDGHGRPMGLVHRDVSPHNLMVGVDGVTRLADFGVAKALDRIASTRTGTIKGKLAYVTPEQAAGREVDQRADLFAIGVVLWEALTRRRLLYAPTAEQTFKRALLAEVPDLSSVDPKLAPLDPVLRKALARNREERFASAAAFARALERAAPAVGGIASPRMVARAVHLLLGPQLEERRCRLRLATETHPPIDRHHASRTTERPGLVSERRLRTTLVAGSRPQAEARRTLVVSVHGEGTRPPHPRAWGALPGHGARAGPGKAVGAPPHREARSAHGAGKTAVRGGSRERIPLVGRAASVDDCRTGGHAQPRGAVGRYSKILGLLVVLGLLCAGGLFLWAG